MPNSQPSQPRRLNAPEIIHATNIIQPESAPINSLDDLPRFCKQAVEEQRLSGACLVRCPELLPPDNDFPDDDTVFFRNKTLSFQQQSKKTLKNEEEFLQISSKTHRAQRYQKPTWVNTTEHDRHLPELLEMVQDRIKDKSSLQRRLICADPDGPNLLLQCGPPLDEYVPETGDGVTTAMGVVSLDNSVFGALLGDWELGWYSLLIAGAPNIFVVISPQSTALFEAKIKEQFRAEALCSQFIRHLGILPSLHFLYNQKIRFSIMYQKVGDVAIIFPGTYCYGFGTGSNYTREISWGLSDWDIDKISYKSCSKDCKATEVLQKPRKRLRSQNAHRPQPDVGGLDDAATIELERFNLSEESEGSQGHDQEFLNRFDHVDEQVQEVLQRAQTEGDVHVRELAFIVSRAWTAIRRWESSR